MTVWRKIVWKSFSLKILNKMIYILYAFSSMNVKIFLEEVIILNKSTNLRLTSSLANERVWSVSAQASDGVCAGTGQATSWGISSCLRTGEWPQRWVARVVGSVSFSV